MSSIPLLCNICPKEPVFSDISHLLTHVASKGHLSHYFKAQVRARQDFSIREKLDRYDRWYSRYHIEKLLSERMTAKEHKDTNARKTSNSSNLSTTTSSKATKPRRRRATTTITQQVISPSPVKTEGVIDPQLSQPLLATPRQQSASPFPPHSLLQDPAVKYRAYVPRMREWHNASPSPYKRLDSTLTKTPSPARPSNSHSGGDSESDYFQTFLRSPSRTAYPDPADLSGLPIAFSPIRQFNETATEGLARDHSLEHDKANAVQSPILKGVKWPGMSLFDSASLEVQRRRNQKKDDSILEQMENNSVAVEQVERIYWPDGFLKAERLITGNVESSPIREPTPPPAPSKRRRTSANKTVLTDLSTNGPKVGRKIRQRKTATRAPTTQTTDLQILSERVLARIDPPQSTYRRNAYIGYDPADDGAAELVLTFGDTKTGRKRDFDIFSDEVEDGRRTPGAKVNPNTIEDSFMQKVHGSHGITHSPDPGSPISRTPLAFSQSWSRHQSGAYPKRPPSNAQLALTGKSMPFLAEDSENVQPMLDSEGRFDDSAGLSIHQRVTQRYFSVTGNDPPQFFSSLPPQMDFGGLAEPRHQGSALNPLNPYLRQQHFQQRHSQNNSHPPANTYHLCNGEKPDWSSSALTRRANRS